MPEPLTPLNPLINVLELRGFIQYKNSTFLDAIIDSVKIMEEIHKIKLLGIKYNWSNRSYLNASDYASMTTIFRRYRKKLLDESLPTVREQLVVAYVEMELFAKRHQELLTEMQKKANAGSLQTVQRPANKRRHVTRVKSEYNYGGDW